ncbi:MAG: hypothetical protein IT340_19995 [Chloroflexi bacterium]|nr:hypothetical protein [Chloroflexota bacterium]
MPDRVVGASQALLLDAPRLTAPVTLTMVDSIGVTQASAVAASDLGQGRWSVTLAGSKFPVEGVYTLTWADADQTVVETISVGKEHQPYSGWEMLLSVLSREVEVREGEVTSATPTSVTDTTLLAGVEDYVGQWLLVHPDAGATLAGRRRRVVAANGSSLVLDRRLPATLARGARYVLVAMDPREVDRALATTMAEVRTRARIPVQVAGLALAQASDLDTSDVLEVAIPAGVLSVHAVYDADGLALARECWRCAPGRKLWLAPGDHFDVGDTITLAGVRGFYPPRYLDSSVDVEPGAITARAAKELMLWRAGSQVVDNRDHLRRMLLLDEEYERGIRFAVGRPQNGSDVVLP